MAITTGAAGIGQEQAIKPAVNHAIAGTQRNAAAIGHEGGQLVVGADIDWFRVCRCMAEGLHHQVS